MLAAIATLSLVPTPSVAPTSTTSSPAKPAALRSNRPPKPPKSASQPGRRVDLQAGLIRSTRAFPAAMSTPAAAYVITSLAAPLAPSWPGRAPCLNSRTASISASPSRVCTLALRLSGVSPSKTPHFLTTACCPPSTSAVTWCTVQPDSVALLLSTASCTSPSIPPANRGSRLGCTLRHRPAHVLQKAGLKMRIQPTQSTRSTACASSTAVTLAS
mmetsp:Transcript_2694/g.6020  ORF Transcript_2694/g.6020 Transcript_2694/m.6020 type:complete len:215 (-) Transcript_2694:1303-1947(-)